MTVAAWDSLGHLNLILAIEAEFGVHFSADDVIGMESLGAIRQVLRNREVEILNGYAPMKRKVCVVVTARPSYSRIKTALKAIVAHPDLELQLVVAASALLDRYGNAVELHRAGRVPHRRARLHGARRREPDRDGQDDGPGAARAGHGLRQPQARRRRDGRRSLRDAGDRRGRGLHEHSGRPHPGRRSHRLDRRESPARRHQARRPAPGFDRQGGRAASSAWAKSPRSCSSPAVRRSTSPPRCCAEPGPRLRSRSSKYGGVGAPLDLSTRLPGRHAAPGDDRIRAGAGAGLRDAAGRARLGCCRRLWFWPNVDAGSDGTSSGIRAFREIEDRRTSTSSRTWRRPISCACSTTARCLIGNSSVGIRECSYLGVPVVNIGSRQIRPRSRSQRASTWATRARRSRTPCSTIWATADTPATRCTAMVMQAPASPIV